jgi:hypothetical protein
MMSALWAEPNDDSSSIGILVSKIAATDHDLPEHIYIEAFSASHRHPSQVRRGLGFPKANP